MGVLKDYTRKDIVEIRNYLIDLVNTLSDKYNKNWTDRNESDIGMFFVELAAGIGDMMNYNIDKAVQEVYLPTAEQRKNIRRILNLINYEMKGPVSAVTKLEFSVTTPLDKTIQIPKYTQVALSRNKGNIYYATREDCELIKGTNKVSVPAIQGIVNVINLTVKDLKTSNKLEILSTKVANKSVDLYVDGIQWKQVPDVLVDDTPGAKFSVHELNTDNIFIEFGYYYEKFLPVDDQSPVTIYYIETEGEHGHVPANSLNVIEDSIIIDDIDYAEILKVTNPIAATGGAPRESTDSAKTNSVNYASSSGAICTLEDYMYKANTLPGVYESYAADWNIRWNGVEGYYTGIPYEVLLYIVPLDNDVYECSSQFLEDIKASYADKLWTTINLIVKSAIIRVVDINLKLYIKSRVPKSNYPKIRESVELTLKEYFKKTNRHFGEKITVGSIEHAIMEASQDIDYCELPNINRSIVLEPAEFPKLGALSIDLVEL